MEEIAERRCTGALMTQRCFVGAPQFAYTPANCGGDPSTTHTQLVRMYITIMCGPRGPGTSVAGPAVECAACAPAVECAACAVRGVV